MAIWETFQFPFMVPKEVPIHKCFSEPQNYNPDSICECSGFRAEGLSFRATIPKSSRLPQGPFM